MEIYIIDIWLEKLRRGWKIEDVPNEAIREAIIGAAPTIAIIAPVGDKMEPTEVTTQLVQKMQVWV